MAGSSSNWFKIPAGPRKGQRVFISNAQLAKAPGGGLSKAGLHSVIAKGLNPNKTTQLLLANSAKSKQPGGQAKSGGEVKSRQTIMRVGEDVPPKPPKPPKPKPYPSEEFWSSVTTGKPGPVGQSSPITPKQQGLFAGGPKQPPGAAGKPRKPPKPPDPYQIPTKGGIRQKAVSDPANPNGPAVYLTLKHGMTAGDAGNAKTNLIFDKKTSGGLLDETPTVNGVPFTSAPRDSWRNHRDVDIGEPPLPEPPTYKSYDKETKRTIDKPKAQSTGVLIQEDDGRIWLYEPTNHFGGYYHTFPKGRLEPGLTPQQNARKEVREELGMDVKITGYLADAEGDVTTTRYYLAKRTGGNPQDAHWEADNVKLVTPETAAKLLNRGRDQKLLKALLEKTPKKSKKK